MSKCPRCIDVKADPTPELGPPPRIALSLVSRHSDAVVEGDCSASGNDLMAPRVVDGLDGLTTS